MNYLLRRYGLENNVVKYYTEIYETDPDDKNPDGYIVIGLYVKDLVYNYLPTADYRYFRYCIHEGFLSSAQIKDFVDCVLKDIDSIGYAKRVRIVVSSVESFFPEMKVRPQQTFYFDTVSFGAVMQDYDAHKTQLVFMPMPEQVDETFMDISDTINNMLTSISYVQMAIGTNETTMHSYFNQNQEDIDRMRHGEDYSLNQMINDVIIAPHLIGMIEDVRNAREKVNAVQYELESKIRMLEEKLNAERERSTNFRKKSFWKRLLWLLFGD